MFLKNTDMSKATLEPTVGSRNLPAKFLTFSLHNESYGIEVLKVREIIRIASITMVPQMPPYLRGVINLRGKIIPVIDLRLRFGLGQAESTDQTCIIVVQVKMPQGKITPMGLVVDAVEEVVNFAAGDIEETPDFGSTLRADYLVGMAKVKGVVKILLDIDRVLATDAMSALTNSLKT